MEETKMKPKSTSKLIINKMKEIDLHIVNNLDISIVCNIEMFNNRMTVWIVEGK